MLQWLPKVRNLPWSGTVFGQLNDIFSFCPVSRSARVKDKLYCRGDSAGAGQKSCKNWAVTPAIINLEHRFSILSTLSSLQSFSKRTTYISFPAILSAKPVSNIHLFPSQKLYFLLSFVVATVVISIMYSLCIQFYSRANRSQANLQMVISFQSESF